MLWGPEDTDWSVEDVEIDEPQGSELLVRNVASGMCHSDEHFITGDMPHGGYPWIAGHEGAGIVEAVGPDVRNFKVGDHVVYSFVAACGQCPSCSEGHSNLCDNGHLIMRFLRIFRSTSSASLVAVQRQVGAQPCMPPK
jgi:Zn-dependent alcohol dehydrogenase